MITVTLDKCLNSMEYKLKPKQQQDVLKSGSLHVLGLFRRYIINIHSSYRSVGKFFQSGTIRWISNGIALSTVKSNLYSNYPPHVDFRDYRPIGHKLARCSGLEMSAILRETIASKLQKLIRLWKKSFP